MKNICIITATRAEYGYLRYLISKIHSSPYFNLQLVVTGSHLIKEQGHTINEIKKDGFPITEEVNVDLDNSSEFAIACNMSCYAKKFADVFFKLNPNVVFVLGDRYELLPICSTAFIMKIPIAHLSGGDVTEGALDDGIRNAITMLASYHFPSTKDSANNIIRMRDSDKNVFIVGEPTLDFYQNEKLLSRNELSDILHIDKNKKWILLTYHPETKESLSYNIQAIKNIIQVLSNLSGVQIVITKSNMDYGGKELNEYLEIIAKDKPHQFKLFTSLGQQRYLSFMKQSAFVIGNSSSGIIETPFLSVPTVNIGNRQKGRHQCSNIIQSSIEIQDIQTSIDSAMHMEKKHSDKNYWGDGNTAEKIYNYILEILGK